MSYRISGTDPSMRFGVGLFNGYEWRAGSWTIAILLKRITAGGWQGLLGEIVNGSSNYAYPLEFAPENQLITARNNSESGPRGGSLNTFNNTTDWMILCCSWDGTTLTNGCIYDYKIGTGSWVHETPSWALTSSGSIGSGYEFILGNVTGNSDDGQFDIVCLGVSKAQKSQATLNSLDMLSFATWKAVFTGANDVLVGFDAIGTRNDINGNGFNETSRTGGISLQSDPAGWNWDSGAAAIRPDYSRFPKYSMRR